MEKVKHGAASALRGILNYPNTVIEGVDLVGDEKDGKWNLSRIVVRVRPAKKVRYACSTCGAVGTKEGKGVERRQWRDNDLNGIPVYLESDTVRTKCPLCGVHVADVPWAYPGSHFTKNFEREVAWMALNMPKSTVAMIKRIDWHTTGRCLERVYEELEPDPTARLNGLKHISVDETGYRHGHKYMTTVVNLDNNQIVWVSENYGKSVFSTFCELLTPEQRASIEIVAGDGARWITDCTKEYFPNAIRCDDPFHVVEWVNDALDDTRKDERRVSYRKLKAEEAKVREIEAAIAKSVKEVKETVDEGTAKAAESGEVPGQVDIDTLQKAAAEARLNVEKLRDEYGQIRGLRYALLKGNENLEPDQEKLIDVLETSNPVLLKCYQLKETLRCILKIGNAEVAAILLNDWIEMCRTCESPHFQKLADKIERNLPYIINFIQLGFSSAQCEQTNSEIHMIIHRAHGFRAFESMKSMIMMSRSGIVIPLAHREEEMARLEDMKKEKREKAAQKRRALIAENLPKIKERLTTLTSVDVEQLYAEALSDLNQVS